MRRTTHLYALSAFASLLMATIAPGAAAQDTAEVHVFPAKDQVILLRLDTLMRRFGEEPITSAERARLEHQISSAVQALRASSDAEHAPFGGARPHPFMRANFDNVIPRGWIGLNLEGPHEVSMRPDGLYIQYFDYPEVLSVEPNSPAEHAGLQRGDMVLAYDGSDLRQTRINVTRMFVPERRVSVAVRRDGEPHEYRVVVGRAPEMFANRRFSFGGPPLAPAEPMPPEMHAGTMVFVAPPMPGGAVVISPNGVFGAAMSTVNAELAKALGLSRGVLVTEAPSGTPAARAGLRAGDVIVRVEGQTVASVPELRAAVMHGLGDDAVTLDVLRSKRVRRVKISW